MEKVYFAGTHRVRHPEHTLKLIGPLLPEFGITRLADVTGLDVIGIPVVMAVRPLSATVSVSQGKGASLELAKVSAAMEAIEFWYAENAVPAPVVTGTAAADLDVEHQLADLDRSPGSLIGDRTPMDWIQARTVSGGHVVLVPRAVAHLGRVTREDWLCYLPAVSSNGLASGNTRAEAIIHGLYEVIERDAVYDLDAVPVGDRTYVDQATVSDPWCVAIIDQLRTAGAWLELVHAPNRLGVPCFAAYLWHEDSAALISVGSGAHSDPAVALSRAMTEAAQSRLTAISGTRDDIPPQTYSQLHSGTARPASTGRVLDWADFAGRPGWSFATDDAEAGFVADLVTRLTQSAPLAIDLCVRDEFAVVKVLCPGLDFSARHDIARPAGSST